MDKKIVELARAFLCNPDTPTSGELLEHMDLVTMMGLIDFGKRMSQDAQEEAIESKLLGRDLIAKEIVNDITHINKNLSKLNQAYMYAMN